MKRYIRSNEILYPNVTELMLTVFNNEYSNLDKFGRQLFDKDYPGWNSTDTIRNYFYRAFEIDNSIKSLFYAADRGDVDALQRSLSDLEYLGGGYPYEKWITEKLISAIS